MPIGGSGADVFGRLLWLGGSIVSIVLGTLLDDDPLVEWLLIILGIALLGPVLSPTARDLMKRTSIWSQAGPIGWNFDDFIGGSQQDLEPAMVRVFQAYGIARRAGAIRDCYLLSHADGTRSRALLSTDAGYLKPADLGLLKAGMRVLAKASFGGQLEPGAGGTLSMPESEFRERWPGFVFVVEYENDILFAQHFTPQEIKDCLDTSFSRGRRAR